jgi:alkylation response protein AidB-like acyl-CoA dehydrogenase
MNTPRQTIGDGDLRTRAEQLLQEVDPSNVDQFAFRIAQFDAGLAWVHYPVGLGGLGLSRDKQQIVNEVLRNGGATYQDLRINPIGIGMAAPTLLTYGSAEMQKAHLPRIFSGEEIWCQMFSEPSHGSDVAGIRSRAVRDGEEWIVNGQKVWTSLGHLATHGLLLTRTNPDAPKHLGLSYFIVDMHSPGLEVRPLVQMTGDAEFNEVFLSDVRVPNHNMLGREGDGWRVATTTLMNERSALGGVERGQGTGPIRHLVDTWRLQSTKWRPAQRAVYQDQVVALWVRSEVLRLTNQRAKAKAQSSQPGPEGSIGKLVSGELNQDIFNLVITLLGSSGLILNPVSVEQISNSTDLPGQFLRSRANTIEGGTSEIMRNIIGERVLGLPKELQVDREIAWKDIPI